MSEMVKKTSKF